MSAILYSIDWNCASPLALARFCLTLQLLGITTSHGAFLRDVSGGFEDMSLAKGLPVRLEG